MSYSIRGLSCIPHTLAYTSNRKFLPLHDDVYKKQYTYMLQYPGNSPSQTVISSAVSHKNPELLKTYHGRAREQSCKNC